MTSWPDSFLGSCLLRKGVRGARRLRALPAVRRVVRAVGRGLRKGPFLSVGDQNDDFSRLGWETLSVVPPADYIVDIKNHRLPLPDGCMLGVNASHVMEHLRDFEAEFFAREVLRVLRPGGVFRVAVPDLQMFVDSYREDGLALHYDRILEPGLSMRDYLAAEVLAGRQDPAVLEPHNGIISIIASYTNGHSLPVAKREEVDARLDRGDIDGFVHWCVSLKDDRQEDFGHFNGFTFERLQRLLQGAGFFPVSRSSFGACGEFGFLRGVDRRDKSAITLYVNAVRPCGPG